jgi:hypothetical protein
MLHDYSGANHEDLTTDSRGWVQVSVPPMSYAIWGPAGIGGGFAPAARRTTQEFQLDDDLGDAAPGSPGYGGRLVANDFRSAGAIWAAAGSVIKVWLYPEDRREVELRIYQPDASGTKSSSTEHYDVSGTSAQDTAAYLEFTSGREGYHQLAARFSGGNRTPVRTYLKVEYEAPAVIGMVLR